MFHVPRVYFRITDLKSDLSLKWSSNLRIFCKAEKEQFSKFVKRK